MDSTDKSPTRHLFDVGETRIPSTFDRTTYIVNGKPAKAERVWDGKKWVTRVTGTLDMTTT